jgi:hypothetical protein
MLYFMTVYFAHGLGVFVAGLIDGPVRADLRRFTMACADKIRPMVVLYWPQFSVFSDLRGLLFRTAGLLDFLADALKPLAAKVRMAFVYGSTAAGCEQRGSDIDLIVVGDVSHAALALHSDVHRNWWADRLIRPSIPHRNSIRSRWPTIHF